MTNKEILEKVIELFKDRSCWIQDAIARMADGMECSYSDPNAVSWCLIGALYKVANGQILKAIWWSTKYGSVIDREGGSRLDLINNSHSYEQMMDLLNLSKNCYLNRD